MASPMKTSQWSAASWRRFPAAQQPEWPDADALKQAEARLATVPPLVFAGEARRLSSQLADALTYAAGVPVVKVGRIAGQFAKPRSSPTERIGDVELTSFRGHIVNEETFDADARR